MQLPYGKEVLVEVRIKSNLLPSLYPNHCEIHEFRGLLQKRAAYDNEESVRLTGGSGPVRVRVFQMKDIVSINDKPFHFIPAKKLTVSESKTVKVKGSSGKEYTLTIQANGRMTCDCPGFGFHGKCRHATEYLKEHGK